jgi:RimJ/RimL family protein N-acetyltransferase
LLYEAGYGRLRRRSEETAKSAPRKEKIHVSKPNASKAKDEGDGLLLRGPRLALRPVEFEDLPLLHQWENNPVMSGDYQVPRPHSLRELERRFLESPSVGEEFGRLLAVTEDDMPVGLLSYHRVSYGPWSPAMNMGIEIAPDYRGKGYGAEAQRLLANYLLAALPIGRVEASTDVENLAEQRSLERAGFHREGVLRRAAWRTGTWHDMMVYSRVHGDE